MKIKTELLGADGAIHKEGRVDTDKLETATFVEYNGRVYCYQASRKLLLARFTECGTPVLLMDKDFDND